MADSLKNFIHEQNLLNMEVKSRCRQKESFKFPHDYTVYRKIMWKIENFVQLKEKITTENDKYQEARRNGSQYIPNGEELTQLIDLRLCEHKSTKV
jgi:hypothetical protein